MKEFIDETSTVEGTPINRANLMAIQGFIASTITFGTDGVIRETNSDNAILVTIISDDKITENFIGRNLKIIPKTTTITNDGISITIGGGV